MKLSAALEYEKLREDETAWNKVILHRDGKFYHAYDWSAWIIKMYVCTEAFQHERGDNSLLQVSRYPSKSGEYAMLGFPIDSIAKYIPTYDDARKMEDSDDIELTISIDFGDADHEALMQSYGEWLASLPVKEKKAKSNAATTHSDGKTPAMVRSGVFGILAKVLSYPVESKTPADNIEFISQLRQEIAALL